MEPMFSATRLLIEMNDTVGVEKRNETLGALNSLPLKQKLSKERTSLTGYPFAQSNLVLHPNPSPPPNESNALALKTKTITMISA